MSEKSVGDDALEVRSRIHEFIVRQFPIARSRPPEDNTDLLESGIVDSLGILEIVNFLAAEFEIEVSDEDLQPENFGTIGSLSGFVRQKLG